MYFMELALGQYSQQGPTRIYGRMAPVFKVIRYKSALFLTCALFMRALLTRGLFTRALCTCTLHAITVSAPLADPSRALAKYCRDRSGTRVPESSARPSRFLACPSVPKADMLGSARYSKAVPAALNILPAGTSFM